MQASLWKIITSSHYLILHFHFICIMKRTLIIIIVALFLLAFYVGLKYAEHHKRKLEKKNTDPSRLKPRSIGARFNFDSKDTDVSIIQMVKALKTRGGRVAHQTKHGAIVYLGESAMSKFNGMLNTPSEEMPLRVIITTNSDGDTLFVRIDEDYGFQMFAGPVKKAFVEKYEEAFNFYKGLLSGCMVQNDA